MTETTSRGVAIARATIALAALGFVALNVWAFAETGLPSAREVITIPLGALAEIIPAHRWATVVTADLVLGWILFSVVIVAVEKSAAQSLPWIVLLFCVGNLVAAVYLLRRLEGLHQ